MKVREEWEAVGRGMGGRENSTIITAPTTNRSVSTTGRTAPTTQNERNSSSSSYSSTFFYDSLSLSLYFSLKKKCSHLLFFLVETGPEMAL